MLTFPVRAEAPTKEQVEKAVDELKAAIDSKEEILQVDAVDHCAHVDDKKVVSLIAKCLQRKSHAVRMSAINALGSMKDPEALKVLHRTYWRDKKLREDEELFAALLKAIGRHGDKSSIRVLLDHPFDHLTLASGTARLMGLANIREKESVDGIIKASRKVGGNRRKSGGSDWRRKFDKPVRTTLTVLTGQDIGSSRAAWQDWWRKERGRFQMSKERPRVPKEVSDFFEQYWGVAYYPDGAPPAPRASGYPYGTRVTRPSKDDVKEAVDTFKKVYDAKDAEAQMHAIESYANLEDPHVIRMIAKGLRYRELRVKVAAADALGWMKSKDALKQLHRFYRRNKDLHREEVLFAHVLKAIGRHGDKSSITVLADSPFKNLTIASGNARVLGLGNIRDKRAVETLMKALVLTGDNPRRGSRASEPRFMDAGRTSLIILTGKDFGNSKDKWLQWWRKNKNGFKMSKTLPKLPPDLQGRWEGYWDVPYLEGATR